MSGFFFLEVSAFFRAVAADRIACAAGVAALLAAAVVALASQGTGAVLGVAAALLAAAVTSFRVWYRERARAAELARKAEVLSQDFRTGLASELMPLQEAIRWLIVEHGSAAEPQLSSKIFDAVRAAAREGQLAFWGRDLRFYPSGGSSVPLHQKIPPAFWRGADFDRSLYVSGSFSAAAHAVTKRDPAGTDYGLSGEPTAYYELLVSRRDVHTVVLGQLSTTNR